MLIFGGVLQFRYLVFSFHVKLRRMIQVGIDEISHPSSGVTTPTFSKIGCNEIISINPAKWATTQQV